MYPLGAGMVQALPGQADPVRAQIDQRGKEHLAVKDNYGSGRGLKAFLEHFWIIAVPEKGVNNRFDYPLGLPLLLVLLPFIYFLYQSLRQGAFPVLPVLSLVYWLFWWAGSQQSRFLFIPLVLIIVTTLAALPRLSKVLMACILAALGLTALSVYRAHAPDFGRPGLAVIREYDRELLARGASAKPGEVIEVETPDAAFAPFAVTVRKEYGFYVLTP